MILPDLKLQQVTKIFLCLLTIIINIIFITKLNSQNQFDVRTTNKFYTTADGLTSNNVYGAIQDFNKFIWFFTDNGITKFDGFSFKNINTNNLLKTSNIWLLTLDYSNRIWLSKHDNTLCYLLNDSLYFLRKHNHDIPLNKIIYYNQDTSFFHCSNNIFLIHYYNNNLAIAKTYSLTSDNNELLLTESDNDNASNYLLKISQLPLIYTQKLKTQSTLNYSYLFDSTLYIRSFNGDTLSIIKLNQTEKAQYEYKKDQFFYTPTSNLLNKNVEISFTSGHLVYHKGQKVRGFNYLTRLGINRSLLDKDNNLWVCTKNNGVLFLPKTHFNFINKFAFEDSNYSSYLCDSTLVVESSFSNYLLIKHFKINFNLKLNGARGFYPWFENMIFAQGSFQPTLIYNKNLLSINKLYNKFNESLNINPIKSLSINKDSLIYFTYNNQIILLTNKNNKIYKSILHEDKNRILNYNLINRENLYYFTRKNIIRINIHDNTLHYISTEINGDTIIGSCISNFNSFNLIGTQKQGLYIIDKDTILKKINNTENINYLNLFQISNYLIAHTNKGIFSYIYKDGDFIFNTVYANSYGLNPDDIKLVYPYNDSIHVVTKNSILAFSPTLIDTTKDTLKVYECFIDNRKIALDKLVIVPYDFNQLSFRFSTFNYTRMDDTKFRYRLKNSDQWINLERNLIELSQLAPGTYNIDIEAYNKFSNEIFATASVPMIVETPWYKTISFLLAMNSLIIGILGVSIWQIYRRRIENQQRINKLNNDINEVKLQALESQMNPHFVYNALASIQYYIQENNIRNAELYLTEFAKLIRSFLTATRNQGINLNDEIILLRRFLELEIMRFDYRFKFNIEVDQTIPLAKIKIPPLLLQPFLENSIQHGLFHRQKNGFIEVKFKMIGKDLYIELTDNGIGIDISKSLPNYKNIKGTSSALSIFKEKIETINKLDQYKISYSIEPLYPDEVEFKGTKIAINFHNIKEKYDDLND